MTYRESNLKHVTLDKVRLHLRTDEKKLWINKKYVLYLNDTSNFIIQSLIDSAYDIDKDKIPDDVVKKITQKYDVSKEKARDDFEAIIGIINSFARDEIPDHMVGTTIVPIENLTSPNRMDLAVTYKCNNKCSHCYLSTNESEKEFSTKEWKNIIDKLWDIGIPEIVFTGGECTLRDDIVELADYSKRFICGIITNGTRLTKEITDKLSKAELDWIQVTLESDNESVHDDMVCRKGAWKETIEGIKNAVESNLSVSINATLTKKNYNDLKGIINLANKLGVKYVSTNAIINAGRGIKAKEQDGLEEKELKKILQEAKKYAEKADIELNWFLPTCYKNLNPVELGFGERICSACAINMLTEPNGDVIPCQSWTHDKLGNIYDVVLLAQDWKEIWNHDLCKKLRNHEFMPEACNDCMYITVCSGACPLDYINGCD